LRHFNYESACDKLLFKEIVALLTQIHEYKGKQALYIQAKPDVLAQLVEVAKIQSTDASNRIEGIHTSNDRLRKLVQDKTRPRNREEQEIAGYREVLNTVHESYAFIPPKSNMILQLHRDLYKFSGLPLGGVYKTTNNVIQVTDASGNQFIRFRPVEAWETAEAMHSMCAAFEQAAGAGQVDVLLAIPMFILDLLCIHPFSDGNGRISRLLTLLLLYRAGFYVGKYISIEKLIEQSKETYYEALHDSSQHWHEAANDYSPFVKYSLGVVLAAYRDFASRVQVLTNHALSKPERVREMIKHKLGSVTKREILEQCPDISQVTVQRALSGLLKNGDILKISGGRYARYTWNREKEL